MNFNSNSATSTCPEALVGATASQYNPFAPVPPPHPLKGARHTQRIRRAEIRAAIRRLLAEGGCENVTIRDVAGTSGFAVQTVYNLVGPRDDAISDAISEYSIFVGRTAMPRPNSPTAIPAIIDKWLESVSTEPEFARQSNLIFFSGSRSIYYRFRDTQMAGMRNLLQRQQNVGIIKKNVDVAALAENLVLYSSALWLEWADRPLPVKILRQKLNYGCGNLLSGKLRPQFDGALSDWLNSIDKSQWSHA